MPALLALHQDVGKVAEHAEICGRCVSNVAGDGEKRKFA
jgi:isoleucyl-tRNA synthetase